jgi:hypothetical protein
MSNDPYLPSFEFDADQSKELSDLILEFLTKHLTKEVTTALAIEVEFKFSPLPKENLSNNVKLFASVVGTCMDGDPHPHPFCRSFPLKTWK